MKTKNKNLKKGTKINSFKKQTNYGNNNTNFDRFHDNMDCYG